jgi:acetylornithine deacetylase/succinyl-diaminopimelate desuccinylase-like protein
VAVAELLCSLVGKNVSVGCIFGADEELGGFTTTWMVEKMGYRPRRMVIVVDSSYGKIGYATKGQLMVRATVTGKGGHSSAPWKCEDLITELSAAIVKIKEEWYRRHPMADGPDHWSDVLTPTVVHSEGTALNRIPSEVWVNFNLRSVRPEAKDECIELIREVTKGKVEVVRYSPPCVSDGNDPYVLRLKKAMEAELKAPVPLERMPFATDARCFVSCKVPVVNVGHDHGDSHGATEWADADSIDRVTRYLTAFLLAE